MNQTQLDRKTQEQLFTVLDGLQEMAQKSKERRQGKLWGKCSVPFTLTAALTALSKNELTAIRRRLEIQRASHLKKGELVVLLAREIPARLEKTVRNFDVERLQLIQQIIANGGFIAEPGLHDDQLNALRECGLIFTGTSQGEKIIAMPEELVNNLFFQKMEPKIISICQRNTEWITLTQGLLYYYGTLSINELLSLLDKYLPESVDGSDFLSVMVHAAQYYQQFQIDANGFSYFRVFDAERVKQEHGMRQTIEFYSFSKEQLLRAGEPEYIDRNDSYQRFVQFLTENYVISEQEADGIVEECVYATNIGEPASNILQFLQSQLEFTSVTTMKAAMEHLTNLMNHTRQWFLKGYTPAELLVRERAFVTSLPVEDREMIDLVTRKKIGRNAPCPCGSGKKYKKCCGR
ncbi:YecA family protein [Bacillus rubiinfantis]|uniref:YecA family protein n=1 Tax=Bacillus rubiinfantis TaxID=1499680 RepID=UPI000693D65E|nr:SEC-C metal-binding domain-containing protein [Bacillus rubiinfantis]